MNRLLNVRSISRKDESAAKKDLETHIIKENAVRKSSRGSRGLEEDMEKSGKHPTDILEGARTGQQPDNMRKLHGKWRGGQPSIKTRAPHQSWPLYASGTVHSGSRRKMYASYTKEKVGTSSRSENCVIEQNYIDKKANLNCDI